jgi:hypothetical protein
MEFVASVNTIFVTFICTISDKALVGDIMLNRLGSHEEVREVAVLHRHVGLEPEATEVAPILILPREALWRWKVISVRSHCA